jgi:hypothetical protein
MPDFDNLYKKGEFKPLLSALDEFIIDEGFDGNGDITDYGRKLQRIYDEIYYNN